jgi:hypothetical protein
VGQGAAAQMRSAGKRSSPEVMTDEELSRNIRELLRDSVADHAAQLDDHARQMQNLLGLITRINKKLEALIESLRRKNGNR